MLGAAVVQVRVLWGRSYRCSFVCVSVDQRGAQRYTRSIKLQNWTQRHSKSFSCCCFGCCFINEQRYCFPCQSCLFCRLVNNFDWTGLSTKKNPCEQRQICWIVSKSTQISHVYGCYERIVRGTVISSSNNPSFEILKWKTHKNSLGAIHLIHSS